MFYVIITLTKRRQRVVKQLNTVRDDVTLRQQLLLYHAKTYTENIVLELTETKLVCIERIAAGIYGR